VSVGVTTSQAQGHKKEILSDDFKKRKIFWKNIADKYPYGKIFYGKFSTSHHYQWPAH
jgi:hypothetical protein